MSTSREVEPVGAEVAATTPRKPIWRRPLGIILIAGLSLVILAVGSSLVMAKFTESNRFCGTDCHEMWPYRDTWEASAHKQTDCVQCHIPPGPVNFAETKMYASREVWVHFTGQVKAPIRVTRHVPNSSCERSGCHTSAEIDKKMQLGKPAPAPFDHGSPGHTKQLCIDCHASLVHGGVPGTPNVPAASMASCFSCHTDGVKNCEYCHTAPHGDRGPCTDCHSLQSWGPKGFKHPQPLVGKHAQIACEQCHTQGVSVKPDGCITCHGDQHNGLANCVDCHRITSWTPTTFIHPQEGPHVPAGEEPLPCDACHQNGFGQKPGCPCHGGNPPTGD